MISLQENNLLQYHSEYKNLILEKSMKGSLAESC